MVWRLRTQGVSVNDAKRLRYWMMDLRHLYCLAAREERNPMKHNDGGCDEQN
jgi:hypothetical protein